MIKEVKETKKTDRSRKGRTERRKQFLKAPAFALDVPQTKKRRIKNNENQDL